MPDENEEMIYLALSTRMFGPVLYGLLVGGVFAAILSTADSQLLVVSSTVVRDVYERLIMGTAPSTSVAKLALSRVVVLSLGSSPSAWPTWPRIWSSGSSSSPGAGSGRPSARRPSSRSMISRRRRAGILAGMIVGSLTIIVWKLWLKEPTGLYELIPGFTLATLAILVVSRLAPDR